MKTVGETEGCSGCPMQRLQPNATFVSPQYPDPKKDLKRLLIGEAPGEEEDKLGKPLVGGSGRLLNKLLYKAGIDRAGLTITNCIQCRPPKNVFPSDHAARSYISKEDAQKSIEHCKRVHVDPLVASRRWNRIDLIGSKPLSIIGQDRRDIGTMRGSPIAVGDIPALATYHPSYLMRDQSMLPVVINDLCKSLEQPPEHYSPWPSLEEVKNFKYKRFSFDIECPQYRTMGDGAPAEMVGLCGKAGEALCVPIAGNYIPELRRIFTEAEEIIGHNAIQFDCPRLFKALDLEWK